MLLLTRTWKAPSLNLSRVFVWVYWSFPLLPTLSDWPTNLSAE